MIPALQTLNKILQTKDYAFIRSNCLEQAHFHGYEQEFNFIEKHYKQFGNIPDMVTFLEKFPEFQPLEVNETDDYLLDRLFEEYGYHKLAPFVKQLGSAVQEDSRLAYNYIVSELPKLKPHTVCRGIDIIANSQERWDLYKNRANDPDKATISTGLKELDEIFGGWDYGDELVTMVARTNQGKCLEKGTKVRMADWSLKNIEDIQVGDKVLANGGGYNTVIATHSGVSNGFRIIPKVGKKQDFTVSSDHYLTCLYKKYKDGKKAYTEKLVDIKIEDFISLSPQEKRHYWLYRPKFEGVHNNNLKIDPYILGGGGNTKNPQTTRFDVIPVPQVEYYGFECDGDHRFILGNGFITHNSWILLKFLTEAWKQGKRVGLYSGEMSHVKLGYRFDALFGHFSNKAITQGFQTDGYKDYITNLTGIPNPFIIITQKEFGGRPTVGKIRHFIEENQIDIMGIDQYSLMEDGRATMRDPTRLRLGHIAEDLFLLSSEYKIPILGLAQANREGAKKEGETDAPGLENIKESDDIAHNSSKCIGLRQSNFGLVLDIIKNREGRVGDKLLYSWDIDTGHFQYIPSAGDAAMPQTRQQYTQQNRDSFAGAGSVNPF